MSASQDLKINGYSLTVWPVSIIIKVSDYWLVGGKSIWFGKGIQGLGTISSWLSVVS